MTLLAAAALLLVGGALAAGSGLLRLPTVVPPVPEPSVDCGRHGIARRDVPEPERIGGTIRKSDPCRGSGRRLDPDRVDGDAPRRITRAVRLQDGRVLVVGGHSGPSGYAQDLTSAELYDPATGTWSATGSISKPLVAATLLRDGKVLVLVGDVDGGPRSAEVYDPASGTWTATGPMDPGAEESDGKFTVLRDGRVLLAGRDGAQVYDPASGTWTATGPMVRGS